MIDFQTVIMKQRFFLTILTALLLWAGCKKIDLDDPVDGTPVFTASFSVDGIPKNIAAGVDQYYMFTEYEKGPDDVYVFSGRLQPKDSCGVNCGDMLTIRFRDFQRVVQGSPDVEMALAPGDYFIKTLPVTDTQWLYDTTRFYTVHFDAASSISSGPVSYVWEFGGLGSGQGISSLFIFDDLSQPVPVTLSIASNNSNCSSSQTRMVSKTSGMEPSCSVKILAVQDSAINTLILLSTDVAGTPPFQYAWSTGDSTDQISVFTNPASNNASVTLTDANGCVAAASVSFVNFQGSVFSYCSADFNYAIEDSFLVDSTLVQVPGDSLQLSRVEVEYQPAGSGQLFRSDLAKQTAGAFFEILSAEDYDDNEKGERTKKLKIRFSCLLKNASGEVLNISNGEAVIGVAFP